MELFDLYDAHRQPTGETMVRGTPTPKNRYRMTVHICIFNHHGEMLIQQRQPFKKTYSGMWDVSVGGCVSSGETSQAGAERELSEELGLTVDLKNTAPTITSYFQGGFDDYYILQMDLAPESLQLQETEVKAVKWAALDEILSMIDSGEFIPYHKSFIQYLFCRRTSNGTLNE